MQTGKGEIVIYQEPEGQLATEVKLEDKTLWLSQKQMGDLFEKDANTIGAHIKHIYADAELDENATVTTFTVPLQVGKRTINRNVKFYNLNVILSVGYRVSSKRRTAFRKWANTVLKDYLIKGYAHNEKLLLEKQAQLDSLKQAVTASPNTMNPLRKSRTNILVTNNQFVSAG